MSKRVNCLDSAKMAFYTAILLMLYSWKINENWDDKVIDILPLPSRLFVSLHDCFVKVYNMSASPRGRAIILNNWKFTRPNKERKGSEVDVEHLECVFKQLDLIVEKWENKTAQVRTWIYSSLLCWFLTSLLSRWHTHHSFYAVTSPGTWVKTTSKH